MTWNLRRFCRPEINNISAWILLLACSCFYAAADVHAGIVSTTGAFQTSAPASNVKPGTKATTPANYAGMPTTEPIVYFESSGVVGGSGMAVDHKVVTTSTVTITPVLSGNVIQSGPFENEKDLNPGTIDPGTPYETYFVHFDPQSHVFYQSDIVFSTQILGVQIFTSSASLQKHTSAPACPAGCTPYTGALEAGDAAAITAGYPANYFPAGDNSRGIEEEAMEINNGGKGITLAGDSFGPSGSYPFGQVDQVRIFVAVPEPASLAIAFTGLAGIMVVCLSRTGARAFRS
jgi:hypothetical protein